MRSRSMRLVRCISSVIHGKRGRFITEGESEKRKRTVKVTFFFSIYAINPSMQAMNFIRCAVTIHIKPSSLKMSVSIKGA
jgi:hypothetical protein